MFLKTVSEEDTRGRIAELYQVQKAQNGFVMSAMRCWTARPDLLPIYQEFSDKIRSGFSLSPRDWRLITLIAAKHVPSTYCSHVYGKQLIPFDNAHAHQCVQEPTYGWLMRFLHGGAMGLGIFRSMYEFVRREPS